VVQGVGFRPFVYNLAQSLELGGWVLNSSAGLVTEVEGGEAALDSFVRSVTREAPPLARIEQTTVAELRPVGEERFVIRESVAQAGEFALVSPDVATCADCRADFTHPANRRFGYPFTNCTNCGPRFTIIRDVPYDRPQTTMARFRMCPACQAEYDDPRDRRFHAQPNACPVCGPALEAPIEAPKEAPIEAARRLLGEGRILAIKGLGGFHLACDATNEAAVKLLRERKRRSDKPFALMARDLAAVEEICVVSDADREALTSARAPVVVMQQRAQTRIAATVAPGNRTLGVMLPYSPLHHLLFADLSNDAPYRVLVMTSGNISEEPIVVANEEARERLRGIADSFLVHDRDIHMRTDDSVVRTFEGKVRVLRRSRGYVPRAIDLGREGPDVLACGAQLKNTFCLTKGRFAILSQHIGDLENYETLRFFEESLANLRKLFHVGELRAVAYDLHPQYLSTRYALGLEGVERIGVQHHHAHVAACMAENHLSGKVIGVAFDGTGYGTDGQIWGGEFLLADEPGFERRAHFRYVPMAGGDMAVRQTWRSALSYAWDAGVLAEWSPPLEREARVVRRMIEQRVNTVMTSSCGRLFDAVASLVGLRHETNFEGQAAIELEMIADAGVEASYPFEIAGEPWQVDFRPVIERIVKEKKAPAWVSAAFHNTVAQAIAEVCRRLRDVEGLTRVCLSGGTFQNVLLLERTLALLRRMGFEVFLHAQIPPNDGGIALGQAVVARSRIEFKSRSGNNHTK
jgi:hydrogenase maturation protein HypF